MSNDNTLSPRRLIGQITDLLNGVGDLDLGGKCNRGGQDVINFEKLKNSCNVLGLYFSAHWCPPCKAFTPQLVECYRKLKEDGHQFEIIFISSDRSESSYKSYLSSMPWTSIPYNHVSVRKSLVSLYNVQGIPSLILLDTQHGGLNVITFDGRHELLEDPDALCFPWYPRLVNILTPRQCKNLYVMPSLILFIEGENEDEVEFAENVLLATAEYFQRAIIDHDRRVLFFVSIQCEINEQLRKYLQIQASYPNVAFLDIPNQKFCKLENENVINKNVLINFVKLYYSEQMKFQHLSSHTDTNQPTHHTNDLEIFL